MASNYVLIAFIPMGHFVQLVMYRSFVTKPTLERLPIGKVSFITNDPCDNLYKISHWKLCIVGGHNISLEAMHCGRPHYLLCTYLLPLLASETRSELRSHRKQLYPFCVSSYNTEQPTTPPPIIATSYATAMVLTAARSRDLVYGHVFIGRDVPCKMTSKQ